MPYRRGYNSQSDYYEDENSRRDIEHESDYWHSKSGQYHLKNNAARAEEIRQRNAEIIHRIFSIYSSNKIATILIISTVLSILTAPLDYFVESIIMWNTAIFILLLVFCYATAKTRIRPEIRDRHDAVMLSAQNKAFRR